MSLGVECGGVGGRRDALLKVTCGRGFHLARTPGFSASARVEVHVSLNTKFSVQENRGISVEMWKQSVIIFSFFFLS